MVMLEYFPDILCIGNVIKADFLPNDFKPLWKIGQSSNVYDADTRESVAENGVAAAVPDTALFYK